jgi:hypothetical protein
LCAESATRMSPYHLVLHFEVGCFLEIHEHHALSGVDGKAKGSG